MAKEFKDYDKKYSKWKGQLLEYELDHPMFKLADAIIYQRSIFWTKQSYTTDTIRKAVYETLGAEEWQRFRVSLKGFSTPEKLYRLVFRLGYYTTLHTSELILRDEFNYETIRFNNYLGALVRGGQLQTDGKVLR